MNWKEVKNSFETALSLASKSGYSGLFKPKKNVAWQLPAKRRQDFVEKGKKFLQSIEELRSFHFATGMDEFIEIEQFEKILDTAQEAIFDEKKYVELNDLVAKLSVVVRSKIHSKLHARGFLCLDIISLAHIPAIPVYIGFLTLALLGPQVAIPITLLALALATAIAIYYVAQIPIDYRLYYSCQIDEIEEFCKLLAPPEEAINEEAFEKEDYLPHDY